jgi:hypothetical protein
MQIICKNCKYNISKIAVSMHLAIAATEFIEKISPFIAKRNILQDINKITDDILVVVANSYKIECPTCFQYQGWGLLEENNNQQID